jgi:WD40 repeat protein
MARGERPLEHGDDAVIQFATGLRELRVTAGSIPYRELARRAHYSAGTLSDAAGGRKLPSLPVALGYVRACGGDAADWERRWRAVAAELATTSDEPTDVDLSGAPYTGLAAFQEQDADRFFGQEDLVDHLVHRVREQRFVAVFGASGAGKSSVLRAGLIARFRAADPTVPVLLFTPGEHPVEECALALAPLGDRPVGVLRAELAADAENLHLYVRQLLAADDAPGDALIVVDQFEEVFTLCQDPGERRAFVDALVAAATTATSRTRIVLGVRTDFYTHCAGVPVLADALRDAQVLVTPMTTDRLRQAIVTPATSAGYTVEGALLAEVIADASDRPGVLPLLSHALLETWRRRRGAALTLAGYQAAGGIAHAVTHTAEAVYRDLDADQQRLAKGLFLRLTALGDNTEDTRRRMVRSELDTDLPGLSTVLDRLTAARLITVDGDTVEITHEALIRHWPRLRGWLGEDREGLRTHRELTAAARGWESLYRDPGSLYRGARLASAWYWAQANPHRLTTLERGFLSTSLDAEATEQAAVRRRATRLRQLCALLAVALVLVTGTSVYAVNAQRSAVSQRDIALSESVAQQATAIRDTNPALALQLSLAAYRLSPTEQARSSLLSGLARPYSTILSGTADPVEAAAFAPVGHLLATCGDDGTTRLWDVTDPHHPVATAVLRGATDVAESVAISQDGRTLATGSADHTVRLWDISDPRHPRAVARLTTSGGVDSVVFGPGGHLLAAAQDDGVTNLWDVTGTRVAALGEARGTAEVDGVSFSPDGRYLATGSTDDDVRLWDVTDPRHPALVSTLTGHSASVDAVAFAPVGHLLATGSSDLTVRLWDVTDLHHPVTLATLRHDNLVLAVAFSPDGRTIATGDFDHVTRLWDVTDPRHPSLSQSLAGHTNAVNGLAFSPDGRTLASASADHTTWLTDLPGPTLTGHSGPVLGVAVSHRGTVVATSGDDGTVRLVDVADPNHPVQLSTLHSPGGAVFNGSTVFAVAFSQDDHVLATGSNDHVVRLWDVTDPRGPTLLAALPGHTQAVRSLAFSPDGHTLAGGSDDHTVRLWNVTDPRHPVPGAVLATEHEDSIESVAFSPDGHTLAAAEGVRIRLWDVSDLERPTTAGVLDGHTNAIWSVAFSPDGHELLSGSDDQTARLWNVADPHHPTALAVLTGHTDSVESVAFGPDGHTVAVGSFDRTIQLWDTTDPSHPALTATLTGHTAAVRALAFSPDGDTLVSGSDDTTALVWDTDVDHATARVCALAHPVITADQWSRYFPELDYRPPC